MAFYPDGLLNYCCLLLLLFTFYLNPNKIRLSRRNKEIILNFMYNYFLYRIIICRFVKNNQICEPSTYKK